MSMKNTAGERPAGKVCKGGRTKPSFASRCDINGIVRRYLRTGEMTHLNAVQGVFADVSQVPDLRGCLEKVASMNESFMKLSPLVRERFHNDPVELMEFLRVAKPEEKEEALKPPVAVVNPPKEPVAPVVTP